MWQLYVYGILQCYPVAGVLVTIDQEESIVSVSWSNLVNSTFTPYTFTLFEIASQAMPVKSWDISSGTQNVTDALYIGKQYS